MNDDYDWLSIFGTVMLVVLPVLAGAAMIFFGIRSWFRARRLAEIGTHVTATVVDNQEHSNSDGQITYYPVVTFRTTDGREIKTALNSSPSNTSHLTDKPIGIIYDPADPDHASTPGNRIAGTIVMIIFGLLFIGFGLVAFNTIHATSGADSFVPDGDWS
ncbi:hypothetical protein GCM10010435_56780 [Winogradskya consettensis]|uniref:DUF3592 domain-containing protein n=1 Tax=Winogradskya consettensis TaxID=113560 RepID=A0A919S9A0_9ACTN|nr:DUF3592 domain-containing protein [Actinoplanes consettensis]GIM67272.1 hypothetical protein Aco04nite_05540 [Actinoplanes consettensis]